MSDTHQIRLILVEDNDMLRPAYVRVLKREGFIVHEVGTSPFAKTAVRLVEQHRPNVFLTDIDLGTENGLEVIRTVCTQIPKQFLPQFAVMSGDAFNFEVTLANSDVMARVEATIMKGTPTHQEDIVAAIRKLATPAA